jgi:hypothetical protein
VGKTVESRLIRNKLKASEKKNSVLQRERKDFMGEHYRKDAKI